jgi:hypothetical protein
VAGKLVALGAASLAALALAANARASNPQIAGLQVALRAHGLYRGAIDSIAGPQTVRATKAFQRRAGLPADGLAGPQTRKALGRLGEPLFGRRTLRQRMIGWDVSVLQFLLTRHGALVSVDGSFGPATNRALRSYQRQHRLGVDGIAGPQTLKALAGGRADLSSRNVRAAPVGVRALLGHWAGVYGVDPRLVRALAWMESGYQPGLVSPSGARGVMQVLPVTRRYVERVFLRRRTPNSVSGGIQVGVVYLRELLREFHGSESLALAGWYQGPASVRRHGATPGTRSFVADVLALRRRGV